jgi:peptidoglycan/LPS O-acetylase OafA/YrhL
MAACITSGIQHIPEFVILALLIFLGWKKPQVGGLLLTILGMVCSITLGLLAYNNGAAIETRFIWGIFILTLPLILGGLSFYFSKTT